MALDRIYMDFQNLHAVPDFHGSTWIYYVDLGDVSDLCVWGLAPCGNVWRPVAPCGGLWPHKAKSCGPYAKPCPVLGWMTGWLAG